MAVDYNPDLQGKLAKSNLTLADIALNDNIPSLANIRSVYGEDNALRWLKVQFDSLNDYAEQGKGITDKQLDELCILVLGEYYWMNLAEICNFISRFKLGKYGQFYGSIGPMKISCSLLEYVKERRIDIERHERERYRLQREKEIEERGNNRISYAEYITEEWNLRIGCPECHSRYDNDRNFRKQQKGIVETIRQHDELAANRYFGL